MTAIPDLARIRFRRWIVVMIWLCIGLSYFCFVGGASGPRRVQPWMFSKDGWIFLLAPSLTSIWLFATLLFVTLSYMAGLLFRPILNPRQLKPWVSILLITVLALAALVVIASSWPPLAHGAEFRVNHVLPIIANFALLALLFLALRGSGRSPWWAALYALHPLPLMEIAANGRWIVAAIIPLVFVAAIAHRLRPFVRIAIAVLTALALVVAILFASFTAPFNSLLADIITSFSGPMFILPILAAIAEICVLLLAFSNQWSLAKTLCHLLVVALICSPVVPAWTVIPLLALLPLAWNRAGWVLSITIFAALAAIISPRLPTWLLMLEWIPVIVVEAQELLDEALSPTSHNSRASVPAASPVP